MSSVATAPKKGFDFKAFLANNGALVGLVILCLALFIATPRFLTGPNLLNIGIQVSTIAVMAFGMTFVIVAAGIDLSVGSVAALSAMGSSYAVTTAGLPDGLSIPVGLAIGALVLAVIRNGLNLLSVSAFWQQVVIGAVIAIAVGFDELRRKNVKH